MMARIIGDKIRVLSVNVRGLSDTKKCFDVIDYLKQLKPHIVCLQDTHWLDINYHELRKQWLGEIIIHGHKSNSCGTAILFNTNFEYSIDLVNKETENLLSIDITIMNVSLKIINIYAPNKDEPNFFELVKKEIQNSTNDYEMSCGDFNLVLNPEIDCNNYKQVNNPRSRNFLINLMKEKNFVDIYRQTYPNVKRYFWRRTIPMKQARLDYFIISKI